MSVLIKGMDMPKDCIKCPLCLFADGYWKCLADGSHADFGGTCRPQNCPLIEVPTPHGRLKDADALIKRDKFYWALSDECYLKIRDIKDEPTVIEAEE